MRTNEVTMLRISAGTPVSPTPAPAPQPAVPSAARAGVATVIRSAGAGLGDASRDAMVTNDKINIYPSEVLFGVHSAFKNSHLPGPVRNVGDKVFYGAGYVAGFSNIIYSSMIGNGPGAFAQQVANRVADKVDGQKTAGSLFPGLIFTAPKQSSEPTTPPVQ